VSRAYGHCVRHLWPVFLLPAYSRPDVPPPTEEFSAVSGRRYEKEIRHDVPFGTCQGWGAPAHSSG